MRRFILNTSGHTPLEIAISRGDTVMIELLTKAAEEQTTTEKEP